MSPMVRNHNRARITAARSWALAALVLLTACNNSRLQSFLSTGGSSSDSPASDGPSGDTYKISSLDIRLASGAAATAIPTTAINFETSTSSTTPITSYCSTGSGGVTASRPCLCQFSWQEMNTSGSTTVPIPRLVKTPLTTVQPWGVTCSAPDVYNKEIPTGTTLRISVVPGPGNTNAFIVPAHSYTKGNDGDTGTFTEVQGHFVDNVLRYTCYEQSRRAMGVWSRLYQATDPSSGREVSFPMASQFCVAKADGTTPSSAECPNMGQVDYSAQSYYYNLYVRSSEKGDINADNDRYVCPRVREPLIPGSGVNQHWPLDSSFALALNYSADFPIGVEAFTKVSGGGDPTAANSSCFSSGSDTTSDKPNTNSLIRSCLGFAAKPAKDGSCPVFSTGVKTVPTYRLRRFVALYPPIYDSNGAPMDNGQGSDTIYVLDRPVRNLAADPRRPYTMRGPKPCPFAFYDSKGVLGVEDPLYPNGLLPTYGATNNTAWEGTNVDGIQFPNTDSVNSCSAALPVLNPDGNIMSIATVNEKNPVFKRKPIRPVHAWAPHYEEDTDFQACAPEPSEPRDPPLHFAKDPSTGNVSWCAEVYPTQNENVTALDTKVGATYLGKVIPFTSHVVKNTTSSSCPASIPPLLPKLPGAGGVCVGGPCYPAASNGACPAVAGPDASTGRARHPSDMPVDTKTILNPGGSVTTTATICSNETCDRTVLNASPVWTKFPLLARPDWVEKAIASDSTFGCIVTYDNGGPKTGVRSPKGGCCGTSVSMSTGLPSASETDATKKNMSAHLEPDVLCGQPDY